MCPITGIPHGDNRPDNICALAAAFQLHRIHAGFLQEPPGVAHRLLDRNLVRHERHIADQQGELAPRATARQ